MGGTRAVFHGVKNRGFRDRGSIYVEIGIGIGLCEGSFFLAALVVIFLRRGGFLGW